MSFVSNHLLYFAVRQSTPSWDYVSHCITLWCRASRFFGYCRNCWQINRSRSWCKYCRQSKLLVKFHIITISTPLIMINMYMCRDTVIFSKILNENITYNTIILLMYCTCMHVAMDEYYYNNLFHQLRSHSSSHSDLIITDS